MVITPFLAMTAAEMRNNSVLPAKVAWMACHFSPYGLGLSNLPKDLPAGSLLMVDDITPPHGHDPVFITEQLSRCVEDLQCCGVLLDFQRKECMETQSVAKHLVEALPCPVVVSECFAGELDCPVFLPPVPPSVALKEYILPWKNREIWLELGMDGEILTLTEQGCRVTPLLCPDWDADGYQDDMLYSHYTIATSKNAARFTLWRTKEDWDRLLKQAEALGVVQTVGLYQELHCSKLI